MKKVPFVLRLLQGAIGKKYVVKHYGYGLVITKFPEMTHIVASTKQKIRRRLFKQAVGFAKRIYIDSKKKEAYWKKLRRPKRFYQALMKVWFREKEEKDCLSKISLKRRDNPICKEKGHTTISIIKISYTKFNVHLPLLALSG